jgi:hypothetical protein
MRGLLFTTFASAAFLLSGCVVRTAADVVTAPVRIASGAVDAATTSQSEADEKRGRELRKREEEYARLDRQYTRLLKQCRDGDRVACNKASGVWAEMQLLLPPASDTDNLD